MSAKVLSPPLAEILDKMSEKAQARGLTPELLESMVEDS